MKLVMAQEKTSGINKLNRIRPLGIIDICTNYDSVTFVWTKVLPLSSHYQSKNKKIQIK